MGERRDSGSWAQQHAAIRCHSTEDEATVARLAADGLWLNDLLGLAPPAGELRERVMARMLELATQD